MRSPSGGTRVVAILGYPVEHSLSPAMHNAAFEALGLDYVYVACPVEPARLHEAVAGLRALGFAGANVTIPHKETVMPALDAMSDRARHIGAVNTIVNTGGALRGDNTDCEGFRRSLEADLAVDMAHRRAVILGAGGAARAVLVALADAGASALTVINRTPDRAERLLADLRPVVGSRNARTVRLDDKRGIRAAVAEADLLVNCTSVGMHDDRTPLPAAWLAGGPAVYDTIYTRETALVRIAHGHGLRAVNGLGMLLHQGAAAFEQWTGQPAPLDVMRDALQEALAPHP